MAGRGWYRFLGGLLIGAGFILPGVSGGVLAVSLGLYRPMLEAVTGFFRNAGKNARYLAPIALGGAAGTVAGAQILTRLMARWETELLFLFIGFVLGGIPGVLREAGRFRKRYLWALLPGLGLAAAFVLLGGEGPGRAVRLSPVQALAAGGVYALGTVIPGLSASFLLMRLGWYQAALDAAGGLAPGTLVPMAAGFLAGTLGTLRGVGWMLKHQSGYAAYGALGFLLGSAALVFPPFRGWTDGAFLGAGLLLSAGMRPGDA